MTIAFTICSNNYLSQAKTLGDSLKLVNPEIKYFVGLVDKFDQIPAEYQSTFSGLDIIEVSKIQIPNFEWMNLNYDIIELNTAVKPYFFKYFLAKDIDKIIYLDPDIYCFQPLDIVTNSLEKHSIIFTPHLTIPIEDDPEIFQVHEKEILNHGIYNLGFTAINNGTEARKFINWWADRLAEQCKHNLCKGLFVDQLWCNLAPVYFKDVKIEMNTGLNMAYWNLYERYLSEKNGSYFVNEKDLLIFFHFSNFDPGIEDNIATKQNRYTLDNRPDLKKIYSFYTTEVEKNHFTPLTRLKCVYGKPSPPIKRYKRVRKWASMPFRKVSYFIEEVL